MPSLTQHPQADVCHFSWVIVGSPVFALPNQLRTGRAARLRRVSWQHVPQIYSSLSYRATCARTLSAVALMLQSQHHLEIVAAETSDHAAHHNAQSKPKRRVVVTGMGCVTSLGHDPKEFYDNLLQVGFLLSANESCMVLTYWKELCHYIIMGAK